MNETVLIQSVRWMPNITASEITALKEEMLEKDSKELILLPQSDDPTFIVGMSLSRYETSGLVNASCAREQWEDGDFRCFHFRRAGLPSFIRHISRYFFPPLPRDVCLNHPPAAESDLLDENFLPFISAEGSGIRKRNPVLDFLKNKTPALIEQELNQRVIGQPALTKAVADFLYYHALRQQHPQLPQRPLLIAGPSGSGKTEVWRVANALYGNVFPIQIIDGSNISAEGWSGNYKVGSYLNEKSTNGGILVVDEFDKLVTPKHSASGENVSLSIQAEFLKLVEGEYRVSQRKELTDMTSKRMGFAMLGAFESLWEQKKAKQTRQFGSIGFCAQNAEVSPSANCDTLTEEDFIRFGMMPELLGRIAVKCTTKALDAAAYLDILRSNHSRVALIEQVLKQYGIHIQNVISDEEILKLVETSKNNRTGVRWVSTQVENRLLEAIREHGLFPAAAEKECA